MTLNKDNALVTAIALTIGLGGGGAGGYHVADKSADLLEQCKPLINHAIKHSEIERFIEDHPR